MRMLTDKELAERIYSLFGEFDGKEATDTAGLLKKIKISAEELLPVGDLTNVHYELMQLISIDGRWQVKYIEELSGKAVMPYKRPYIVEEIANSL